MIVEIVKQVVKGMVSGAFASFIGYAKQEEVEKWELEKALKTTILGMLTQGFIYGSGMPISEFAVEISTWLDIPALTPIVVEFAILTGIVMVTDQLVKILIRRTAIANAWNKVKAYLGKYL